MTKQYWLALASIILLCTASGCTEDNEIGDCNPACGDNETCVNGTCKPNSDTSICNPACGSDHTCVNGTCKPNTPNDSDECNPACGENETCVGGTCKPNGDTSICNPACGNDETCVDGTCKPNSDASTCEPACGAHETCVDGTCKVASCSPNSCIGRDYYCGENGTWETCELGTGCHMGFCLPGLGKECNTGSCSDDGLRACKDDTWVTCGSMDKCVNGECVVADTPCEPKSCSEDRMYQCNEAGKFEACAIGTICSEEAGQCISDVDRQAAMLWPLCKIHSDCTSGMCLFEVSTSKPLTSYKIGVVDASIIPVTKLDARIPVGYGICSMDCTKDANNCNSLNSGNLKYSCHVAAVGESSYPPKDAEGNRLELPFHRELNKTAMKEGVPFAAICRPNDVAQIKYEETFCIECNSDSDCGNSELCVANSCLPKCNTSEMCPLGFSCLASTLDDSETGDKVCVPAGLSCGSCADADGDGQGYGHCNDKRFDCNPLDEKISYKPEDVPTVCSETPTDTNCNGKIDFFEIIGSNEHCRFCNDLCGQGGNTSLHLTTGCKINDDTQMFRDADLKYTQIDDYEYASKFNAADEATHLTSCQSVCDETYADCDGRASNGCETKIIDVTRESVPAGTDDNNETVEVITNITLLETPVMTDRYGNQTEGIAHQYEYDNDGDRAVLGDPKQQIYCCDNIYQLKPEPNTACYAFPNSHYNSNASWDLADLSNTSIFHPTVVGDCDDNDSSRSPGEHDVCDGKDNDCDPTTPDGSHTYLPESMGGTGNSEYIPYFVKWYGEDGTLNSKIYKIGEQCPVVVNDKICSETGIVQCDPSVKALICVNENSALNTLDTTCDGIDDDCDGILDDDYVSNIEEGDVYDENGQKIINEDKSINICKYKTTVCEHTYNHNSGTWIAQEVQYSLYNKRERDFYGDGIDSNCDGYDFDYHHAVFVNKYGSEGEFAGNDETHEGTYNSPYATLRKALSKACGGDSYDPKKTSFISHLIYCNDVFVSKEVGQSQEATDPWATTPLRLPYISILDLLKKSVEDMPTGPDLGTLTNLLCELTGSHCQSGTSNKLINCHGNGCAQDYPYPGEVYPPKERIRILGGWSMDTDNGNWSPSEEKSTYFYKLPADINLDRNDRFFPLISSGDGLAAGDQDYYSPFAAPISVRFENMKFDFNGSTHTLKDPNGLTMVGLSCGPRGCEDLVFVNSTISVTGANGTDGKTIEHISNKAFLEKTPENESALYSSSDNATGVNAAVSYVKNYYIPQAYNIVANTTFDLQLYGQTATGNKYVKDENDESCESRDKTKNIFYPSRYKTANLFVKEDEVRWPSPTEDKVICPDGASPLGGTPGAVQYSNDFDSYFYIVNNVATDEIKDNSIRDSLQCTWSGSKKRYGLSGEKGGENILGGVGGPIGEEASKIYGTCEHCTSCYDQYNCKMDAGTSVSADNPKAFCAGNGEHGTGGMGGSFFDENGKFKADPFSVRMGTYGMVVDSNRALGAGKVGISGGGGGGGNAGEIIQLELGSLERAWGHAGSGGMGGCGGRGGAAGGTGASVIGMQLSHPIDSSMLNFKVEALTGNLITLQAGKGGNGQPGQPGLYGGWRGKGTVVQGKDKCTYMAAGGVGGTGGGGGGGAAGLAGQSYGFVMVCQKSGVKAEDIVEEDMAIKEDIYKKCGFDVSEGTYLRNVMNYPEKYVGITSVTHGGSGSNGLDGSDPVSTDTDINNKEPDAVKANTPAKSPSVQVNGSTATQTNGYNGTNGGLPGTEDSGIEAYKRYLQFIVDTAY